MSYIDGFVLAVPSDTKDQYQEYSTSFNKILVAEYGATKATECWGDDVPEGELTSLPMAVKAKENETVVFSWIVWPSKEARDKGWKEAMDDPRFNPETHPMPFDGKRMIFGGFEVLVEVD